MEKQWDYERNTEDPWKIASKGGKTVWLKCTNTDYHDSYSVKANDFSNDKSKCPYCRGLKVHILDSVGYKYSQVFDIWSDKNKLSPYNYTLGTGKKAWFKCENGVHDDYFRQIREVVASEFHCPDCTRLRTESRLEEKTRVYLTDTCCLLTEHEYSCSIIAINPKTGYKMPYDNEVFLPNNQHLIIEVMGEQHYDCNCGWIKLSAEKHGITPEEELKYIQWKDAYKKQYALDNGYHYLELPYWTFNADSYKTLIDNKIQEILSTIQN